jgi:hypothetical protein
LCAVAPDANLVSIVAQPPRLKSSFIYLANAVNDLRGNVGLLTLALAPLVVITSLCLLPDAINLQSALARHFGMGVHSVSFTPVQVPYQPVGPPGPMPIAPWIVTTLQIIAILMTLVLGTLVVLCTLDRIHGGARAPTLLEEVFAVYRRAIELAGPSTLIFLLQLLVAAVAIILILGPIVVAFILTSSAPFTLLLDWHLLVFPALIAFFFVCFSQIALVFDRHRSWHSLLYSRDLMRGRFFKVAMRIVVFLAVWSGYNAWTGAMFLVMSWILGPVAVLTGWISAIVFMTDLLAVAVAYATIAFFIAAGVRLYQDLVAFTNQEVAAAREMAPIKTAELPRPAEA